MWVAFCTPSLPCTPEIPFMDEDLKVIYDIAKLWPDRFACIHVGTRANHGDGFQMGSDGFHTAQH